MFVPARSCTRIRATFRVVFGLLIACVPVLVFAAATFSVNSTADIPDENPGDGICRTASNNTTCTLRAAIMEANALPTIKGQVDTINLQPNTTYTLTRAGEDDSGLNGDLDVLDSVTIIGAGPASTILDANGAVTNDRVMEILQGVVHISGVAFRHGKQSGGSGGGGIRNAGGTLTLQNCAITDNTSAVGGGVSTQATTTVIASTISGNQGGGIFQNSGSTLTVVNSTISGNSGAAFGGGIGAAGATFNAINTTISGNSTVGYGGGLYVAGASVGLYNVTVAANQANSAGIGTATGGGMYNTGGATVALSNSIITNNEYIPGGGSMLHVIDDCSGAFTSTGYNIVTVVVAAHCTITGSYSTAGASLGLLQNNGGPTLTHALLVGSAAVDAGNPSGCAYNDNPDAILISDQRGVPRPNGPRCDLGAFELDYIIFQDGFEP
jgi:CSLREA domain-containing protein